MACSIKTLRKYQEVGPSKGDGALTKKQAEIERDRYLAKLNAPTIEMAVEKVATTASPCLGKLPGCMKKAISAAPTRSPSPPT
jgi:hypothetical protein